MTPSTWLRRAALLAVAIASPALAQFPAPLPTYPPPPPSSPPPPQPVYAPPPQPVYAPPPQAYAPPPPAYPPPRPPPAASGGVQLSAYTGWQMNGDVSAYAGKLKIDDAMNYGVAIDVPTGFGAGVQLLWIYNDTTARFSSYDPFYPSSREFGLQQHYFQVGGTKMIRRGKIETFGGGTLGAALFIPGNIQTNTGSTIPASDTWAFAMTLGGGVKVFFTEKVALRLGARLMLPMFFQGGGFYVGSGGSGMSVSAGVPSVQGDFTAGLTIAL